MKNFKWQNVRLLISAGKVDKRKTFFKTLEKIGTVENFDALTADDKDWAERAEVVARAAIRERQKEISEEALAELVARIGPNARQLENEIEKLSLFAGASTAGGAAGRARRQRLPAGDRRRTAQLLADVAGPVGAVAAESGGVLPAIPV